MVQPPRGKTRDLCDHNIIISSTVTMNIQESHLALEHIFCMFTESYLFEKNLDK
jgi:D-sedoheptulose 7-phosphate isomerase